MSYKKIIGVLLVLAVFGIGIAYIFMEPIKFGICQSTYTYEWNGDEYVGCLDETAESVGQPLGLFSLSLIILSLILFFTKEAVFRTWGKFALWFLPLSAFLIFITPAGCGGGFGGFDCLVDREIAAWFMSGLFLIVSLFIIGIKSLKLKGVSTSKVFRIVIFAIVALIIIAYLLEWVF